MAPQHSMIEDDRDKEHPVPRFQEEEPPRAAAAAHLKQLEKSFNTGRYSDLTITCGGRQWKVHSFQISHQSEVLEKMITGRFKEAEERKVDLCEDDPDAINHLLRWCYKFTYHPEPHTTGQLSPMVLHFCVAIAADKYMMPELCELAFARFREDGKTYWRYQEFADAFREAWPADDHQRFRDELMHLATPHMQDTIIDAGSHRGFWDAAEQTPGFAADLLRHTVPLIAPEQENGVTRKRYPCPGCGSVFLASTKDDMFAHGCGDGEGYKMNVRSWEEYAVDA